MIHCAPRVAALSGGDAGGNAGTDADTGVPVVRESEGEK
jgi:hypothetical protein